MRAWAWVIFSGMVVAAMVLWGVEASLSADMMVWLLPLMIALAGSEEGSDGANRALLIAALGCAVRLTCLPLLAYAGVVWVFERRGRRLGHVVAACGLLLLVTAANYRASGCPLFPSPVGCSTGASSVGPAFAAEVSTDIRASTAKLNRHFPEFVGVALLASALALALKRRDGFVLRCLGVSWSGLVFMAATRTANPRFGLGCFCLPVALAGAVLLERVRWRAPEWVVRGALTAGAVCVGVLSLHGAGWILPARMARFNGDPTQMISRKFNRVTTLAITEEQAGEVRFLRPLPGNDQCWDAALPCTRETVVDSLRLVEPDRGLGGGFASDGQRRLK
jgi:hypothetical protein